MPAFIPSPARRASPPSRSTSLVRTRRELLAGAALAVAGAALARSAVPSFAAAMSESTGCDCSEENPGLIGDDAWVGTSFGLAVSWEPVRWVVGSRRNPDVAKAMGREDRPVDCGFGQGGSDRLTLVDGMWESGVYLIESYDRLMWTPESMAEAMDQPGWVQNLGVVQGSRLLLAESAGTTLAAVAGDADNPGHTVYWQATFPEDDDAVIHNLTLHMWEAGAVYALHDLEGVAIDGIDPFTVVDLETVRQVIDDYSGEE